MKNILRTMLAAAVFLLAAACNNIMIDLPLGPAGNQGRSAYEVWKSEVASGAVDWPAGKTEITDYFVYLKGEKGDQGLSSYEVWKDFISSGDAPDPHDPDKMWNPGADSQVDYWNYLTGRDGKTPHVGENGNWWIGTIDTGVKASATDGKDGVDGKDGEDGRSSYSMWCTLVKDREIDWPYEQTTQRDYFIYLKGMDGATGLTPHVGLNGNWYIGSLDTGVKATGPKGDTGDAGADGQTPRIGDNGNWWIGTTDTGVKATGDKGESGEAGKDGNTPYIKDGNWWIGTTDTGIKATGDKGDTGADGADGADGVSPFIGDNNHWWVGTTDTGIDATGPKGDKGDTGDAGKNGNTPYIKDGNWWIGTTDTNVPATGEKGDKGETGEAGADGNDGKTPYIKDGNWWIGTTDTNIPATGEKGDKGETGKDGAAGADGADGNDGKDGVSPHIGDNGNWYIGTTDTGIPASGTDGNAGLSAYQLWVNDVKAGTAVDRDGNIWPASNVTMADFYLYLSGADGKDGADGADGEDGVKGHDGLSAYEIWYENAISSKLDDPRRPGEKWPSTSVTVADFFAYLSGTDGQDGTSGTDGLSAYELWKDELAEKAGTDHALIDNRNGGVWNPDRNTVSDFLEYLRGADGIDGANGSDGKPGVPGTPGATVVVKAGVPNVIAQYSQAEYGEYVRTSDGAVLYKVYDKNGALAANAEVKGMPGIDPEKTYISDSNGEFLVPKEDLPEIEDWNYRWGSVTSVKINGETMESARNTYVPNRIYARMRYYKGDLSDRTLTWLFLERKVSPDSEWESMPVYLSLLSSLTFSTYLVNDPADPQTLGALVGPSSVYTETSLVSYIRRFEVRRMILENNRLDYKNLYDTFWPGTEMYVTFVGSVFYGSPLRWNGCTQVPVFQIAPDIDNLTLKTKSQPSASETLFASVSGNFVMDGVDFTRLYKPTPAVVRTDGGEKETVKYDAYPEAEARNLKELYVKFHRTISGSGTSGTDSQTNLSGGNNTGFFALTPYLGSDINIGTAHTYLFAAHQLGQLTYDSDKGRYVVRITGSYTVTPDIKIVYED